MRTISQVEEKYVTYMNDIDFLYTPEGYVMWRRSTGDNIEILFIEVKKKGKGTATKLMKQMTKQIRPYHSVFVFRLKSNETAGHFYRSLGFIEQEVKGLYKKEPAILGVITYKQLCSL